MRTTRLLLAAAVLASASLPAAAQQMATGVVFEDRNGNGVRDAGEPGLAGIAVSNGADVVLTDAEGRYEIPVGDDTIVWVRKPSTHDAPVDSNNLPQFYTIHKPAGSPPYYYPGVPPTGPLPESVDFALLPKDRVDHFTAVFMADTQPETANEVAHLRRTLFTELVGTDAKFIVNLGDIMFDQLELFDPYVAAIGSIGIPVHHVIGNHDLNFDAPDNSTKGETYQRWFGPLNYSWQEGDVHFVSFDNIYWRGREEGRFATNLYDTVMIQEGLDWLAKDLESVDPSMLVVIGIHGPLHYHRGRRQYVDNLEAFYEVVADRERVLAVSGHTHTNYIHVFGEEDGWTAPGSLVCLNSVVASGSWWSGPSDHRGIPYSIQRDGTPAGYTILEFHGNEYTIHFKGTERPHDDQVRVYPPGQHSAGDDPRTTVLANVYYGPRDSQVQMRLNGGDWIPMEFKPQRDPLAEQLFSGPADTGKPWVNPVVSHHIWEGTLPARPPAGVNRWEVRAILPDGREFRGASLH